MSGAVDDFAFDKMRGTWEGGAGEGVEMPGSQVIFYWWYEDHQHIMQFANKEVIREVRQKRKNSNGINFPLSNNQINT